MNIENILVSSTKNKNNIPDKITLLSLNNYPVICKSGFSVSRNFLESYYKKNNLEFIPTFELSNNWIVEEYSKLGVGLGIVSKQFVLGDLKEKTLFEVKTDIELPTSIMCFAYRKNSVNYAIIKEFINLLKKSNMN